MYPAVQSWALQLCSVPYPSAPPGTYSINDLPLSLTDLLEPQSLLNYPLPVNHSKSLSIPHLKFVFFNQRSPLPFCALSPLNLSIHLCSIFSHLNPLQSVLSPYHCARWSIPSDQIQHLGSSMWPCPLQWLRSSQHSWPTLLETPSLPHPPGHTTPLNNGSVSIGSFASFSLFVWTFSQDLFTFSFYLSLLFSSLLLWTELCPLKIRMFEAPTPNVMVSGGGAFGR